MRNWLLPVVAIAASLTAAAPGLAGTIAAKSGSAPDIQDAIRHAGPGDTVAIPAGRFEFRGQVFAPDGIHLRGAGRDRTYLVKVDDLGEWHAMITVDARTGRPFIFSGITLEGRLDALQGGNRRSAVTKVKDQGLLIRGAAKQLQIYDSRFTKFVRAGVELVGDSGTMHGSQTGVIYHNQFIDNWFPYLGYGVAVVGSASAWNRPAPLGTADALFIEDNYFERNRHAVTASNGARYVARYNTVKDNYQDAGAFDAHGKTPAWPTGTRSVEIYHNLVLDGVKRWAGAEIRGGGGVVWGNVFKGVSHGVQIIFENLPASQALATYPTRYQVSALYLWDNKAEPGGEVALSPTPNSHGIDYWLRAGRDYFLAPMPGYAPYTYPHPLRAHRQADASPPP